MGTRDRLAVFYNERLVGELAEVENKKIAFSYSDEWIKNGFPISPFSLPLKSEIFIPSNYNFDGMFGVFADSLPDAWGRLLFDRMLKKNGIDRNEISSLDRLAIVGDFGTGALCYRPTMELRHNIENSFHSDFDKLAEDCAKVLQSIDIENLDELYIYAGSSGGARPKVNIVEEGQTWLVKFPATGDSENIGEIEAKYMACANNCGIPVVEYKLFSSKKCSGYFGSKRFDIENGERKHVLTTAAIFEVDYRTPCLAYENLIKLAGILSLNSAEEKEKMYRLMCFNILAHNQDDHAKNFSFIYDYDEDLWRLSPAYDLTYSNTYYGEQTTTLNGKGKSFEKEDFLSVAGIVGMSKKSIGNIYDDIRVKVDDLLASL